MVHLYSNSNNNSDSGYGGTTSTTRNILRAILHAGPCFNQHDPEPL
ncbi:MAG TPA: hypothetical protein VIR34_09945 [Gemmatimonadaceae bacterium]|jgi:hypothetical protein